MSVLVALGLVLLLGLSGGVVARKLGLPSITGYVVIGLLLGPTVTGVISYEMVLALGPVVDIALGAIAYLIGVSLHTSTLRSLGRSISWITLLQVFGGFLAVVAGLMLVIARVMPGYSLLQEYLPFALLMGAISAATAPAAVLAIIRELRAKGPMTTTLLAVVALDDAIAVVLFAVMMVASAVLAGIAIDGSPLLIVIDPFVHLAGAVLLGVGAAGGTLLLARFVRSREVTLVLVLGAVVLSYGLAEAFSMSGIMACMSLGFVIGNRRRAGDLVLAVDDVQAVLFTMFFVVSGFHFDAAAISVAGPLAVVVVVVRCLGKYFGARLGAWIGRAPPGVGENVGLALMPQAGVSLGLALVAAASFPEMAAALISVTIASVIINELITPPMARKALVRAGEARPEGREERA